MFNYIMLLSDGKTRPFYGQDDQDALTLAETYASQCNLKLVDVFKSMLNAS